MIFLSRIRILLKEPYVNRIYDYTDYRAFLRDRFDEMKRKNPKFSYRVFNRLAGIESSGFLKLVVDGKRNLADDGIRKIAKGFKLGDSEIAYFDSLVRFNQAATAEEKEQHYQKLARNKKFGESRPLAAAQYRLFSQWYYPVILEIVRLDAKTARSAEWVHSRIYPPVALDHIRQAIKDLMQLGLIAEGEGKNPPLSPTESVLATEPEVASLTVAQFHKEMSSLASKAVMSEPSEHREFAALTLATSPEGFEKIRNELRRFANRLHMALEADSHRSKTLVAHVNLQLFKLTRPEGK